MGNWVRHTLSYFAKVLLTVALGGFLAATMVRFAPGFGMDEQELDPRLRQESVEALRAARAGERNLFAFYAAYFRGVLHGDLGTSRSLGRPVRALFAERIPVTLRNVALGLAGGWLVALALALPIAVSRFPAYDLFTAFLSGSFLSIPSAVLALLTLFAGAPAGLAVALVVFPRVFRYCRNLLVEGRNLPHVLLAEAKGLAPARVLFWHVAPSVAPQVLALAGVSVSVAFGAAIPIEVICDSSGIGQLAWQAALGRDLPLLVNITALVTAVVIAANSVSDLASSAWAAERRQ